MEEYLTQLFEQDGAAIYRTDYQLFFKLLEKYPTGPLRSDAYCINAILGGNAFYRSVVAALKNDSHEVSRTEYNVIVSQMLSGDRFWKNEALDPAHLEYILRMLYRVASVNISNIPMTNIHFETVAVNREDLSGELSSAETAYNNKIYRTAFEKSTKLFENGISSAASILCKAYYYGNGTQKNYNQALFYLSYPHKRDSQQDKEERKMLESLLALRDKSVYASLVCLSASAVLFLFMLVTGFFNRHVGFAIFNTVLLIAGSVLFVMTYKKKLIFDLSYWFLILGCMFLIILIL